MQNDADKQQFLAFLEHHQPDLADFYFDLEKNDLDSAEGWKLTATPAGLYHTAFLLFRLLLENKQSATPLADQTTPSVKGQPLVWFLPIGSKAQAPKNKAGEMDGAKLLGIIGILIGFSIFLLGAFRAVELLQLWW